MGGSIFDHAFDDLASITYDGFFHGYGAEDELARLRSENERLRAERDNYYLLYRTWFKRWQNLTAKIERRGINV